MKELNIDLKNCYGIRKLQHRFDFSTRREFAIYAPNGSIKSSLAQSFKDIETESKSVDRVFPQRESSSQFKDENGDDLSKDSVFVIRPCDETYGHTEKTSTLLIDSKLRKEYEQLHIEIDKSKAVFLKVLKQQSGSKKNIEAVISQTFINKDDELFRALSRIENELLEEKEAPFANAFH